MAKGPVLIDLDDAPPPQEDVNNAPPVPEPQGGPTGAPPRGEAMQIAARLAARRPSRLLRWFWGLVAALIGAAVSVAAWDFAAGLVARVPLLGWAVSGLMAALLAVAAVICLREIAAIGRLGRVDALRRAAAAATDLAAARAVIAQLRQFYRGREDTAWGRERLSEREADIFDPPALFDLAETVLLAPLDAAAAREVEAAARQVATVTALVPLALADVAAALTANLRMIRRVAEIYGGHSGFLGSWRLTRAVLSHLVATGAVAVGDDLLEPVLGGSILSKLSRRFGEGLVNGALTARVGVAAMEVCRPLPFSTPTRPSVRRLIARALTGFATGRQTPDQSNG